MLCRILQIFYIEYAQLFKKLGKILSDQWAYTNVGEIDLTDLEKKKKKKKRKIDLEILICECNGNWTQFYRSLSSQSLC